MKTQYKESLDDQNNLDELNRWKKSIKQFLTDIEELWKEFGKWKLYESLKALWKPAVDSSWISDF